MNGPIPELSGWSRARWWRAVGVALVVQLALIFWLGERGQTPPRAARPQTVILWSGGARLEPVPFEEPVLLVLPGEQGFSGKAWMRRTAPARPEMTWAAPPRWLPLTADTLGTNAPRASWSESGMSWSFAGISPPPAALPSPPESLPILAAESRLVIEGGLAEWPLVSAPALPAWPAEDILSPSVVQVQVDHFGRVFTAVLLAGSGLSQADQRALELAPLLRFAPRPATSTNEWARGVVRFEWHTLPVATATNAPPR